MRRILAIASSALLLLALAVPVVVAQGEPYIDGITVTSATVSRTGEVTITGTLVCHNMDNWDNIWITYGQLTQAMGRKTTISGQVQGGLWEPCDGNGTTLWGGTVYQADRGIFGPGWATVNVKFGNGGCDQNGCWGQDFGYGSLYVKVTKR